MSELERWEGRFATGKYVFGEEANGFLASCKKLLPKSGKVLSVADGEGRNGVWLAEQGLDVVSLDFAPTAQKKVRALADQRGVDLEIVQGDVHEWDYPKETYDVVVEIFTQFSSPEQRAKKWAGMRKSLKKGGLLILQGYSPKQLEFGTGGPKRIENLYSRAMIEKEFAGFTQQTIEEMELEMNEGSGHAGMSAVINFTGRK